MDENQRGRVVGVVPTRRAFEAVLHRLEVAGFDHAQFGVLAPETAAVDWRQPKELARDPKVRTAAVPDPGSLAAGEAGLISTGLIVGGLAAAAGPILAGGGLGIALASLVTGGGAGGLVGALLAHGFHDRHAVYVESQLERGGIVLWVLTRNIDQEDEAVEALRDGGATDVQVQASLKSR